MPSRARQIEFHLSDPQTLSAKTAIVTGASSGIGLALAPRSVPKVGRAEMSALVHKSQA